MINSANITTIYVSQKRGSDLFTGFYPQDKGDFQGPLQTIETALERVTELRRAGAGQPISIVITDDVYSLKKTILIKNNVNRVTIRGAHNTVISGGIQITGFVEDVFNGRRCFSAPVPGVKEGYLFTDLYVDGLRANFATFPKEGYYLSESVENPSMEVGASSKWFIAKPEDLEVFRGIKHLEECIVSYNHYWVDEHSPLESWDLKSGKFIFKYKSRFTISPDSEKGRIRYRLENVAEAFGEPGDWYLDRENARVYYAPLEESQTPDNISVYAPVLTRLFVVEGDKDRQVEHITFRNLTFAYTRGDYVSVWSKTDHLGTGIGREYLSMEDTCYAADEQSVQKAPASIEFYSARGCAVEHCTLRNLGLYGISLGLGSNGTRIYGNRFCYLGAGGVKIGGGYYGCEKWEETFGNTVSQNIITSCGERYYAACGILMKHTYGNTVSHNEISYLFYTGISLGWVWGYADSITRDNLIEKNHIHHIGQGVLSDMGGIYALGAQPGTILRGNVIHDVESRHYGGHCIYTDEGSSYMLIENNICYGGNSTGFNQHYGRMNTIRNNIFVKAGEEPVRSSKAELHPSVILEGNIIVADGTASYRAGYGRQDTGYFHKLAGSRNLHFNTLGDVKIFELKNVSYTLEEVKEKYGLEDGSVVADPMFRDYVNNDFTLAEDSPAYELGFERIDTSDVGVTIQCR